MSFDVQPYLESICATYAQWWKLYTLTDAEGQPRPSSPTPMTPFFDFGLMVQTAPKRDLGQDRGDRSDRVEEKVERFTVLDGLRKYAAPDQDLPHVLLVGRPGSGKSTALARLMLEEASQTSEVSKTFEVSVPILIELRYWQGSLSDLIHNAIARHDSTLRAVPLERLLTHALLLFDGVNELPSEEARSQLMAFRRDHPKVPMIFTTRDLGLGGDLGIEQKLEMQPLTEAQMQAFVRAYVPEQAEALLRQLKDRLRELGQTPLLLWMLCGLFQQTGTIPENLGLVFRLFTQGYERNLKQDVVIESDRAWWQPVLQQLAWVMMQGAQPTELRVAIPRKEAVGAIAQFLNGKVPYTEDFARKCLRDLQKHHLIQAGTNPEELEFRHQLLQEYYAAEALLERLPDLSDGELQREYLNYLKWTEPVALMLALVGEEQAVRVVRLALDVDWSLGAQLAGKVKGEFQAQTVGFVNRLKIPGWLKVKLLEKIRSNDTVPGLLKLVEHADPHVRGSAISELGKIGSKTAIFSLLKLLEDAHFYVRHSAAEALGQIGCETAIFSLLKLLKDPNLSVRRSAANALGMIGSKTAIPSLIELLENDDHDIRASAADILGQTGSNTAITGLRQLLEDPNLSVRRSAANALSRINPEADIPSLLKICHPELFKTVENQDSYIYFNDKVPDVLEDIGSGFVVSSSFRECQHEKTIKALFEFNEKFLPLLIPAFLEALDSEDLIARSNASEFLRKANPENVFPGLLFSLIYPNHVVRFRASNALRSMGSEKVFSLLSSLDYGLSWKIIYLLVNIFPEWLSAQLDSELLELLDKTIVFFSASGIPFREADFIASGCFFGRLLKKIKQHNFNLSNSEVHVFGEVFSEQFLPILLQESLEDEQPAISISTTHITHALEQMTLDELIAGLLKLMEDSEQFVRTSAARVLETVNPKDAISGLLKLVEHSNPEVAGRATEMLEKVNSENVIFGLLRLLEYAESDVAGRVAISLGRIGSKTAIPSLLTLMEAADSSVRWHAAEALGEIGSKTAIPGLLTLLEDADSSVRWHAANALGKIGSETAIPGLLTLLEDTDSSVRWHAANALGNIAKQHTDTVAPRLTHLFTLIPTKSGKNAHHVILAIQASCKYYNHSIQNEKLEIEHEQQGWLLGQATQSQLTQPSPSSGTTIHVAGDYIAGNKLQFDKIASNKTEFPNATEVKIFEQVDRYHETPPQDPAS